MGTTRQRGRGQVVRTNYCGELRSEHIGATVSVCGWVDRRREHGEHLAFIDLRDHTGVVQCVVDEKHDLRSEYVVRVTGIVRARPDGTVNDTLATGEVEIGDCEVEVLSVAEPPPFPLHDRTEVDETLRLRHRYVDLRRAKMQRNLRVRAKLNSALRRSMEAQGFCEIETPMLIASTPEGARDFVVPSRLHPGNFYALPQSPQLFKQLCMVGGVDRYFQIARCLRDEDLRADRQFEFMQLDVEASFVTQDDVLEFVATAVSDAAEAITGERPTNIPSMTWHEAQERFGSDKPDVRFGMELVELTDVFEETDAKVFQVDCVKGIVLSGGAEALGRNAIDDLTDKCKRWGAKGLAWFRVREGGELDGALTKFMSEDELAAVPERLGAQAGDLALIIADRRRVVNHVLGLLRLELGRPPVNEGGLHFLWVTDFPLFEDVDESGRPAPAHHPFTMPHPDDVELLGGTAEDLLKMRSQAYDLVLNGWELGSGSVRIHRPDIQQQIFSLLGIEPAEAQERFGFLLDAFRYGAPPHAGFAFGIDRLVALLVGEENIREVIAFPKTQSGADPLTNAPSPIDAAQLDELGLRVLPPKN
ncbi:MAG: aspartate--tRNA ligase [Acidimicrobiales bacterium]|nr:aspartate--tRNA ligase [Acidimicrobiales bacterium]